MLDDFRLPRDAVIFSPISEIIHKVSNLLQNSVIMATHLDLCPAPSRDLLRERFVGKSLKDLETPAAVIDLSITQRNCQKLLEAMEELGFGWRAHIKTHKVGNYPFFSILKFLDYLRMNNSSWDKPLYTLFSSH